MNVIEDSNNYINRIEPLLRAINNSDDLNDVKNLISTLTLMDMTIYALFDGTPELALNIILSDSLMTKINSQLLDLYNNFKGEIKLGIVENWIDTYNSLKAEKKLVMKEWEEQGGVKTVDVDALHERFEGVVDLLSQISIFE